MKLLVKLLLYTGMSVVFLSTAGQSLAANICWDGGGSTTNWSEDANWAGNVEPGSGDVAVFDNSTCTGSPNKNATIDTNIDVQGVNIAAYAGTITQNSATAATIGSAGFTQASSTSTYTGNSGAGTAISLDNGGDFTLSNGAFTSPWLILVTDNFTVSGGTFTSPTGTTVTFITDADGTMTITGNVSFYDMSITDTSGSDEITISSGTTITVNNDLTLSDEQTGFGDVQLDGPGNIHLKGDLILVDDGVHGDAEIVLNGTGAQNITGVSNGEDGSVPSITIDKPSGTVDITGSIWIWSSLTYTQGTVDANTSHIRLSADDDAASQIAGSISLYDVTIGQTNCVNNTYTVTSGTTFTVSNDLELMDDSSGCGTLTLNGPGTIVVQGDISNSTSEAPAGNVGITLTGTNAQSITLTTATNLPSGTLTINKSSGTVTLGSALTLDGTGQDLVISSGILDMSTRALAVDDVITVNGGLRQGTGNLTATNGNMTIGSTGWWLNNSTGDFVMDGGDTLTNNGYVRLDGTSAGCGGADGITLTRSGAGSVNLAGSGRWRIFDVGISNYSASPALTVYSSTNTTGNSGITFTGTCPSERTWIGSGNYNTGANWTGSTVPGLTEVAVFDATSTNNMAINTDPNDLGFQVNLGYTGTITQNSSVNFSLGTQGYEQNSGSFTGSNAQILIVGDFAMKGGTFASTSGPFYFGSTFEINGGTFNPGSGEVIAYVLDAGNGLTTEFSGNVTLNDLRIYTDQCCNGGTITVLSGTTVTVNGDLVLDGDGADERNRLLGPGEIHAKGDIQIDNLGFRGDAVIVINGNGAQNLIGQSNPADVAMLPAVEIDKPSGTLTISAIVMPTESWTYTQGTLSTAGSTVVFLTGMDSGVNDNFTASGTHTLHNVTAYFANCCNPRSLTVSSGTITAAGDLTIDGIDLQTQQMLGPGSLAVQGNLNITQAGGGATGDISLSFTGGNAQSITVGSSANIPTGSWSINKSSNTLSLASTLSLSGTGQDLTITQGTLTNGSFALTVNDTLAINDTFTQGSGIVTAGTYTIGAGGSYNNNSTGDMVVGSGGVANSGTINFGDPEACGVDNEIAITSSSNGQQRSWSGPGIFNIYDVTVRDQGGSAAITAYSSQNISGNGANWTFDNTCPDIPDVNQILLQGSTRIFGGTRIDRD